MSPSSRLGFRSASSRCLRCRERWPQFQGLCRTCWREAGEPVVDSLATLRVAPPERTGRRSIQVEGEEFLVVWDGSTRMPILEALTQDLRDPSA